MPTREHFASPLYNGASITEGEHMADGTAPPGWYMAPGGRRRWWDGQSWHDQKTTPAPPAPGAGAASQGAPSDSRPSGLAIASTIVGIIGIVLAVNAYTKPLLFLGYGDIFGPLVLGGVGVVLASLSGRSGGGFRLAGVICSAFSVAAGLLFIYAIVNR